MLKTWVRGVVRNTCPGFDNLLHSRGMRKHFRQTFRKRQRISKRKAYGGDAPVIIGGPFAGMLYLDEVVWGPIEPKWFGTYEAELHAIIEQIIGTGYQTIVDVGSAEGFYSVGLALKMPEARVNSFDIDPWARAQQRRLARLNNVTNLTIASRCAPRDLDALHRGRSLLICDIEGAEYELLNPRKAASLRSYDILVEMHPCEERRLTALGGAEALRKRFEATHQVESVAATARAVDMVANYDNLSSFCSEELARCLDEGRNYDQCWLWLLSHESAAVSREFQLAPTTSVVADCSDRLFDPEHANAGSKPDEMWA